MKIYRHRGRWKWRCLVNTAHGTMRVAGTCPTWEQAMIAALTTRWTLEQKKAPGRNLRRPHNASGN
jgi:hypothetical protein